VVGIISSLFIIYKRRYIYLTNMDNISIIHANNTRPYKVEISAFIAMYIIHSPIIIPRRRA